MTTDLRAAVAHITRITPEGVAWGKDEFAVYIADFPDHATVILNAVASGNLVLTADVDGLVGALTPSGDTKAAYMGEIKDPETNRMVSWTAIKMIMAMILAHTGIKGKHQ